VRCDKRQEGSWKPFQAWATSDAVLSGQGQKNTLVVVGQGDRFAFYVNGQRVIDFVDGAFKEGQILFTVTTPTAARVDAAFESVKVWEAR
jgi:hypothetical protein